MKLVDVISVGNTLGEGVVWDAESATLWWTDIQEKRLFRRDHALREIVSFELPERLGSFALVRDSRRLIGAFESGLALFDPAGGRLEWLARPADHPPGHRFNDGRVDRQGRFWTGTMVEAEGTKEAASLYCLDRSGRLHRRERGIGISNGICWSPDGARLYFSDSPLRTIFVYDFDAETGTISNRRMFATTPEGAYPDGANVDAEGHLWSAHWGAGCVVRYAPDGSIERTLEIPASQPTCVAFGGPDLDLLFVTSAREGLKEEALLRHPSAGHLFVYRVDVRGVSDPRFAFESAAHREGVEGTGRSDDFTGPRPESDL